MADAPCGCAALEDAAKKPPGDPAREHETEQALDDADAWRCPARGHAEPHPYEPPDLPPAARDALERVRELTGAEGFRTCPCWYLRAPWVHRAVRAHAWREAGELKTLEPRPPAALCEAIDLVAAGIAARERREAEDRERKAALDAQQPPPSPR